MTNGPITSSTNFAMLNEVYKMVKKIAKKKKKKKKKKPVGSNYRDYRGVDGVVDDATKPK